MRKTVKGALAAGVGGVLLLGGAGTLAYWSDSESITGGDIDSGTLSLTQEVGQTCSDWTLDAAGGATTYTPGTTLVVPGDVITKTCDYTVHASGAHLAADLGLDAGTISGDADLVNALDAIATYKLDGVIVATGADITSANEGDVLQAVIAVTFDPATAGTTAQAMTAALADLTVTLTQTHPVV
jgi:alternate signal-mediated exported protein